METNTIKTEGVKKQHPLFKWILVVGIMIVANLFLNYALDAFYPAPKYETFCPNKQVNEAILTKDACLIKGGQWSENVVPKDVSRAAPIPVSIKPEIAGYCNENFTCSKNFEEVNKFYNRNIFIVLVIAGTAFLVGGMFVAAIEAVALGFSFAGVLSLIVGTLRYWSSMDDKLRVVVLGFALMALVWVGIKKFKN